MAAEFRAELIVRSTELPLAAIEALIGKPSGPKSYSTGDPWQVGGRYPVRRWTHWYLPLQMDPSRHAGVDGLEAALRLFPAELADRFAACVDAGCWIWLDICQSLDEYDRVASTGISLSQESIAWLARARARIDIDQYIEERSSAVGRLVRRLRTGNDPPL